MQTDRAPLIDVAVLDDDLDFCRYVEDFLKHDSIYSVRTFTRPGDLFYAFEQRPPGIVLLDVMMGETRGDKVREDLLARWPAACVIIVTGYPSFEGMRETFKKRAFDYLVKPFSISKLRETLGNAAAEYGFGISDTSRLRLSLGRRIRLLRLDRDWSLKNLADASKLSISLISCIERGIHLPSMESLVAIAGAFGLRPSQLLSSIDF